MANVKDKVKGIWLTHTVLGYQAAGNDMGLYKHGLDDGIGGWLYCLGDGTGKTSNSWRRRRWWWWWWWWWWLIIMIIKIWSKKLHSFSYAASDKSQSYKSFPAAIHVFSVHQNCSFQQSKGDVAQLLLNCCSTRQFKPFNLPYPNIPVLRLSLIIPARKVDLT